MTTITSNVVPYTGLRTLLGDGLVDATRLNHMYTDVFPDEMDEMPDEIGIRIQLHAFGFFHAVRYAHLSPFPVFICPSIPCPSVSAPSFFFSQCFYAEPTLLRVFIRPSIYPSGSGSSFVASPLWTQVYCPTSHIQSRFFPQAGFAGGCGWRKYEYFCLPRNCRVETKKSAARVQGYLAHKECPTRGFTTHI